MNQMEALFDELSNEDGEYQLSLKWATKHTYDETTGKWIDVINPRKDTFEYDGMSVWWATEENEKHPDTPVVVVSWQIQKREDDFDEFEQEVDATAEDLDSFFKSINRSGGYPEDPYVPDTLEEMYD